MWSNMPIPAGWTSRRAFRFLKQQRALWNFAITVLFSSIVTSFKIQSMGSVSRVLVQ